ncbi:NAD-dependent epimerase/dehydratase family protein [Sinomicrobium soli]|uniref:NAD-dependent epimerase/dehydratase family protein n=1 Tax=Sinomicrobium sp. N-1-3-6 TaxID=2219864 RepID=UPI000DCF225C|nr:NAD-dependent epimerase/dehydratase family protein [Sinomicrobium sp. N-1-3-6]RAV28156.1 NAD-dependent epimerase [Sinomicrobium sp. N-1-3-6]
MILVTGGTGLVGAHLLHALSRQEEHIRAIYRKGSDIAAVKTLFEELKDPEARFGRITWVEADITDIPALSDAFKGISRVYHAAAFISFDPADYHLLKKINTEGTANIVNLCLAHRVRKLCFASSVATLGKTASPDEFITEDTHWNTESENNVYAISKYGAEMEVWRGSQEGLDVVIVNPGIILGIPPGKKGWKTGSGRIFREIDRGLNHYTEGITGYVDVTDVVAIMTGLMQSDLRNERYVAVGENLSYRQVFTAIAGALDKKPPRKEVPAWTLPLLWRLDWLTGRITGKPRRITRLTARSAIARHYYNSEKIKAALGITFNPVADTISRTGQYYRQLREHSGKKGEQT